MITTADLFFVRCLASIATLTTFDELRDDTYHNKSIKLDLEKLPSTSSPIKLHIQRAYLQSYKWYRALFDEVLDVNPTDFGYVRDKIQHIFLCLVTV